MSSSSTEGGVPRYLPSRGAGRIAWLGMSAWILVFKLEAIFRYRPDSDEAQHAHVAWGWTTGRLQYRDVFDNHMPLFHILFAPVIALAGERPYIIVILRWFMLPLYLLCVGCAFRLAATLFSRRAAPWVALVAAAIPPFFYCSTEFRTDDLWAALWILSLLVAVTGQFTMRRAFLAGFVAGLAMVVSAKTSFLLVAVIVATVTTVLVASVLRKGVDFRCIASRLLLIATGLVIPVAPIFLFFAAKGAFGIAYYCIVSHNAALGLKKWKGFSSFEYSFFISIPILAAVSWFIFHQTSDTRLALRRSIVILIPWAYIALLISYCPTITREDYLPFLPLTPLIALPFVAWLGTRVASPVLHGAFWNILLPLFCFMEILWLFTPARSPFHGMALAQRRIRDVITLTDPKDFVMDAKGENIFRARPFYWIFDPITNNRMRFGGIHVDVTAALEQTATKVCYLSCSRFLPQRDREFVLSNYMLFDAPSQVLGVAGKEMTVGTSPGAYSCDIAIPATYAVVSESGTTEGQLDGVTYSGPLALPPGRHLFHRTGGKGRVALFLARALDSGFHPLFDDTEAYFKMHISEKQNFENVKDWNGG